MYALVIVVGGLVDRIGRARSLSGGLLLMGLSVSGLLWLEEVHAIAAALLGLGLGWNLSFVAATAELSDRSQPWERGRLLGLNDLLSSGAGTGLTLLGGLVLTARRDSRAGARRHGAGGPARPVDPVATHYLKEEIMSSPQQIVRVNGIDLCVQSFGDPADPPVLLVMGIGGSMLWWDEGFCRLLADRGRFVLRYDHRDTGRSVTYPPGHPGYTGADLVADAAGVLDAYGIPAAHLVGVSAGGGIAQELALERPERVRSLVLLSTSPALPTGRRLPPPTEAFTRFVSTATVDWSDAASFVEYQVGYQRVLAGGQRPFDEPAARDLARREVERARDLAAVQNHDLIAGDAATSRPLSSIGVPTLVIHGSADPMFPLGHGQALAEEIPGARLLVLEGAGHGLDRADWQTVAGAVLDHTAAATEGPA